MSVSTAFPAPPSARKQNACKKKGFAATRIAPQPTARSEEKKRKKKTKKEQKRKEEQKAREASEQEATKGGVARL